MRSMQSATAIIPVSQNDADLWLMDLKTGECKELKALNSKWSESFHNWSDNSHWFVYTSKKEDGMYAQLYIASIDAHEFREKLIGQKRINVTVP